MLKKILPVKTFSLSISRGERRPGTKICVSTSLGEWDTIRAIMEIGGKKRKEQKLLKICLLVFNCRFGHCGLHLKRLQNQFAFSRFLTK